MRNINGEEGGLGRVADFDHQRDAEQRDDCQCQHEQR